MPRPRKCRLVAGSPRFTVYKPQGAPLRGLAWGVLPVEGLEALRLVDAEGLDQEAAAARMGVSRPTLNRILGTARAVVARALSQGWALRIEGGDWVLAGEEGTCIPPCRRGRGRGRCGRGGRDSGPGNPQTHGGEES